MPPALSSLAKAYKDTHLPQEIRIAGDWFSRCPPETACKHGPTWDLKFIFLVIREGIESPVAEYDMVQHGDFTCGSHFLKCTRAPQVRIGGKRVPGRVVVNEYQCACSEFHGITDYGRTVKRDFVRRSRSDFAPADEPLAAVKHQSPAFFVGKALEARCHNLIHSLGFENLTGCRSTFLVRKAPAQFNGGEDDGSLGLLDAGMTQRSSMESRDSPRSESPPARNIVRERSITFIEDVPLRSKIAINSPVERVPAPAAASLSRGLSLRVKSLIFIAYKF